MRTTDVNLIDYALETLLKMTMASSMKAIVQYTVQLQEKITQHETINGITKNTKRGKQQPFPELIKKKNS